MVGTWIPPLFYADDIVLISDSSEGMEHHLDALHRFAHDSGLSIDLGKTKVMVFNTTPQWIRRLTLAFTYSHETVEHTNAYTYLEVIFTRPIFSLRRATKIRLIKAYAALGGLERCVHRFSFKSLGQSSSFFIL